VLSITSSGNTNQTDAFLDAMIKGNFYSNLESFAQRGVDALKSATPQETGETAAEWSYEVKMGENPTIWWINTHVVNGFHVAIGLQYGHGTGSGGWVQGYDYINPAIRPIMDDIANAVWKEVQSA
jgi:hypothetical protein